MALRGRRWREMEEVEMEDGGGRWRGMEDGGDSSSVERQGEGMEEGGIW